MSIGVAFYESDWFTIKKGKELLYESLIRILITIPGERVMRPDFGVGIESNVFKLVTPDFLQDLAISIHMSLLRYETRIKVKEVQTEHDQDEGIVKIRIISEKDTDPNDVDITTLRYNVGS